jgi:O-antigen/teichoic acid export membrane protein
MLDGNDRRPGGRWRALRSRLRFGHSRSESFVAEPADGQPIAVAPGESHTPDASDPGHSEAAEVRARLRGRVFAGIATVGLQGLVVQLLSAVGGIVIARLLIPSELGIVAFGTIVVASMTTLADAGLGAALIRQEDTPADADLSAVVGLQAALAAALTAGAAVVAPFTGLTGQVTAVMVGSLVITALGTGPLIILERNLTYRPILLSASAQAIVYYAWSILFVLAGFGVWGLATGTLVRAAIGMLVLALAQPSAMVMPRLAWKRSKRLLRFGARYQAVNVTNLVRDQVFSIGVVAISGLSTFGLWAVAYRIFQIPLLLFSSLWRVSYPAMARLLEAGEDPKYMIERGIVLDSTFTGILVSPLVGAAPALVPAVLGAKWTAVDQIVPGSGIGLLIGGPISVTTAGFLWAVGESRVPLRATISHTLVWWVVTFPLLPILGPWAISVGSVCGSITDSYMLGAAASRVTNASMVKPQVVQILTAGGASALAWWFATAGPPTLLRALAAAMLAEAAYVLVLLVVRRGPLLQTIAVTGRTVRHGVRARA